MAGGGGKVSSIRPMLQIGNKSQIKKQFELILSYQRRKLQDLVRTIFFSPEVASSSGHFGLNQKDQWVKNSSACYVHKDIGFQLFVKEAPSPLDFRVNQELNQRDLWNK